MLKNKKMMGLLIGVCILLCSIVVLTTTSSKPKTSQLQDTPIIDIDKSDIKDQETTDNSQKEETTDTSSTSQKNDTSSHKDNSQTLPKEDKSPSQESNQSQNNTQTNKPTTPESTSQYVYLSIDCKTILNNMSDLPEKYKEYVPSDGIILSSKKVKISEGDTVFDVIMEASKKYKYNVKNITRQFGYITSIRYLPEKMFNGSGGWMYSVNGKFADKGSQDYKLKNDDKIEWRYTCYIGDIYK